MTPHAIEFAHFRFLHCVLDFARFRISISRPSQKYPFLKFWTTGAGDMTGKRLAIFTKIVDFLPKQVLGGSDFFTLCVFYKWYFVSATSRDASNGQEFLKSDVEIGSYEVRIRYPTILGSGHRRLLGRQKHPI